MRSAGFVYLPVGPSEADLARSLDRNGGGGPCTRPSLATLFASLPLLQHSPRTGKFVLTETVDSRSLSAQAALQQPTGLSPPTCPSPRSSLPFVLPAFYFLDGGLAFDLSRHMQVPG